MIVAFFILYNFGSSFLRSICLKKYFKKAKWEFIIFDVPTLEDTECRYDPTNNLKFSPPLYKQRYTVVKTILESFSRKNGPLKIIDFGCAQLKLFQYIKHMQGVEEYIGVDIDEEILSRYSCSVEPLLFDYLKKRIGPFKVKILCGSVAQPDSRLLNSDAVVAIELIEHLFPGVLEDLPYNIFGIIQPKIAIFTTPNSEFNIFFNSTGFRHYDHKFEWTREQFQSWALNLELRYPNYRVVFGGVGSKPVSHQDVGFCTQIAVFCRNNIKFDTLSSLDDSYKIIKQVEFPFHTEIEHLEEIIEYESNKFLLYYQEDDDGAEIPLKDIHNFLLSNDCSCTLDQLRNLLVSRGRTIQQHPDSSYVVILAPYHHSETEESVESYISSSSQHYHDQQPYDTASQPFEEDWDVDIFVPIMDPSNSRITEINDTTADGSPSSGLAQQQETLSLTNIEPSRPNTINVNSVQSETDWEEAQARSSSSKSEKYTNSESYFKFASSYPTGNEDENAYENSLFVRPLLQKCHSLENLYKYRGKYNSFRFSLNIDKDKFIDCDIGRAQNDEVQKASSVHSVSDTIAPRQEDSCSQSRAADSGYPNSYGQDMDMDLTPEQVDEIITESESSFDGDVEDESGGEDEEPIEVHGEIVRLGENVENGDVANNNRDDEGNNMEAAGAEIVLQFEQVIAGDEIADGNLAAAMIPDSDEDLGCFSIVDASVRDVDDLFTDFIEVPNFVIQADNPVFPNWLLSILIDDLDGEDDGAGDAATLRQPDNLEHEDSNDEAESAIDGPELIVEPSLEMFVEGDLMGGGEPSPDEH